MSFKIEHQVCSLEQADKLKMLGVKQNSLFYWQQKLAGPPGYEAVYKTLVNSERNPLSAFTSAELGEMLPGVLAANIEFIPRVYKFEPQNNWHITGWPRSALLLKSFETEALVRAELLISLIEHGKILVTDINKKLD